MRESAFDKNKNKPGLALTGIQTTGPWYILYYAMIRKTTDGNDG